MKHSLMPVLVLLGSSLVMAQCQMWEHPSPSYHPPAGPDIQLAYHQGRSLVMGITGFSYNPLNVEVFQ